jgi:NitT/TauT family transport system substrate-binding protein
LIVRFGQVANPFSRPVDLALRRGYFDEASVRLDLTRYANGSAVAAALAAGEIDAGVGGHVQTLGAGQVFFAPLGFEEAPGHLPIALVARPGISSGRELAGHAVGMSARGAISELQLRIYMHAEGAAYETLRLEAMPFTELAEAMRSGAIAAASAPEPFATQLVADGLGTAIDRGSLSRGVRPGERVLITGLAAERRWVESNRKAAHRVAEAVGRAVDELAPDETPNTPRFSRRLDPAELQRVYDLAFEHGLLERPADARETIVALGG